MYKAIVVDDEEMIRKGICNVIPWRDLGVSKVSMASSGKEAIEIMKNESMDIMVTDICMSEMDGLTLVEKMNILNPNLKIIVLTGYDNFEYAQKCCKMKVNDFLLKPIDEDELEVVIQRLVSELKEEQQKVEKQRTIIRAQGTAEQGKLEEVMQNILHYGGQVSSYNDVLIEYSLIENRFLQVALISPIVDDNLAWKNHYKLLNLSIKKACIEVFDCNNKGITFEDINKNIVIIMFTDESLTASNEDVEVLVRYLKDEYNVRQKVILGSRVNGIEKIKISYNDAIMLINEKGIYDNVIVDRESEELIKSFINEVYNCKKNMSNNINDLDGLINIYEKFSITVDSYNLSIALIRKYYFEVACQLYFINMEDNGGDRDDKLSSLAISLQGASKDDVVRITREFITNMCSLEKDETGEIIRKAKRYIKNNLDKPLSVYSIAEMLYLTPTYFSRLFKNSTGEGCNNYIVRKKIEKAKLLLETTTLKTGKIAQLVGYKDTNYFSLAFKKQTDLSPTEYRDIKSKVLV